MVLGEILSGMNILEKLGRLWKSLRAKKKAPSETIITRFVRLLECHGIHRNQIPRFIGHGLTLKDVQDETSLLAKLDEPLLKGVCERFAVRREWLDGADSQIYPCHDFYKHPEAFSDFIEKIAAENPNANLHGVLIAPEESRNDDALLILQETIGFVGEKPIYRFHLCNNWLFTYWKARAYLTACVAIAWKNNVFVHGLRMQPAEIDKLIWGKALLGWEGEGIWRLGHKEWDPEDMALKPESFLKDIDPEENDYGIKSGLRLWLDLEERGLMNAGFGKNARSAFQQKLDKYQAHS